jgi:hypothetical protein
MRWNADASHPLMPDQASGDTALSDRECADHGFARDPKSIHMLALECTIGFHLRCHSQDERDPRRFPRIAKLEEVATIPPGTSVRNLQLTGAICGR